MQKRMLGQAGPEVSRFALGTMTFGNEADEKVAHEMASVLNQRPQVSAVQDIPAQRTTNSVVQGLTA